MQGLGIHTVTSGRCAGIHRWGGRLHTARHRPLARTPSAGQEITNDGAALGRTKKIRDN